MGNQGRPSKSFQNGSNVHNGASRSQSGNQSYGGSPKPQRGNGGSKPRSTNIADVIFGPNPVQWGHGGKKKRKK